MHKQASVTAAACTALALLTFACGAADEGPAPTSAAADVAPVDVSPAAVVPGADFIAKVDVAAIRDTSACKDLADDAGKPDPDAAAEGEEEAAAAAKKAMQLAELKRITGLTPDDVVSLLVAADIDSLDLDAEHRSENLEKANGVVAINIAKPLTPAKLAEALKLVSKDEEGQASEIEVAGYPAVHVQSTEPEKPDMYAAVATGNRTVFLAGNQASLEGALQRANSGDFGTIPPPLETVRQTLPAGAQVKLAFLTPAKLQEGIQEQLAKAQQDPEAARWAGMLDPFKGMKSLGMGVECGAELKVGIGADLGAAEAAQQVAAMLNGMVVPMAKSGLAQELGKTPAELQDRFSVSSDGSALKISVRLTQEDVAGLRKDDDDEDEDEPATAPPAEVN